MKKFAFLTILFCASASLCAQEKSNLFFGVWTDKGIAFSSLFGVEVDPDKGDPIELELWELACWGHAPGKGFADCALTRRRFDALQGDALQPRDIIDYAIQGLNNLSVQDLRPRKGKFKLDATGTNADGKPIVLELWFDFVQEGEELILTEFKGEEYLQEGTRRTPERTYRVLDLSKEKKVITAFPGYRLVAPSAPTPNE